MNSTSNHSLAPRPGPLHVHEGFGARLQLKLEPFEGPLSTGAGYFGPAGVGVREGAAVGLRVAVAGIRVAVGEDVAVAVGDGKGVAVGVQVAVLAGVSVGGIGVSVGGIGVSVGGTGVLIGGNGVADGARATALGALVGGAVAGAALHAPRKTVATHKTTNMKNGLEHFIGRSFFLIWFRQV